MSKKTELKILIAFLLTITSCHSDQGLSEIEKEKILRETKQTLLNYQLDVKDNGLLAEFNYLDSSSNFFWLPPGYNSPLSFDSVAAILKQNANNWEMIDNSFDTLIVMPLDRKRAVYAGRLRSVMTDTSGRTSTFLMLEAGQLIERNGRWKLLSGETTILR